MTKGKREGLSQDGLSEAWLSYLLAKWALAIEAHLGCAKHATPGVDTKWDSYTEQLNTMGTNVSNSVISTSCISAANSL